MENNEANLEEIEKKKKDVLSKIEKGYIIPKVNDNGMFSFHPPLDTMDINQKVYKVKEIRSLKVLYEDGLSPLTEIYEPLTLTKDDYIKDLEEEVPVATLTSNGADNIYIPCRYIKSMPNFNGITYTARAVTFKFGIIPDSLDLGNIYSNIKTDLQDALNTIVEFKEINISDSIVVPEKDHDEYMSGIDNKFKEHNSSYRLKYYELLEVHKNLLVEYNSMSKYIHKLMKEKEKEEEERLKAEAEALRASIEE